MSSDDPNREDDRVPRDSERKPRRPRIAPEADDEGLPPPAADTRKRPARRKRKARLKKAGDGDASRREADEGDMPAREPRKRAARKKRRKKRASRRRAASDAPAREAEADVPAAEGDAGEKPRRRKRRSEKSEGRGRRKKRSGERSSRRRKRDAGEDGGRRRRRSAFSRDLRALDIVPHAPGPDDRRKEKILLVNATDREEARIALLVDGRLEEIYVEAVTEKSATGNVYRGRIQNVERGIGAAFVDVGRGVTGFLHASDMPAPKESEKEKDDGNDGTDGKDKTEKEEPSSAIDRLSPGDEVIVQITRDSIGRKGPALTGRVSLPGRYLVLMPFTERSGISRRIPQGPERERMRKLLRKLTLPEGMGIIVRTASETTDLAALEADRDHLLSEWERIRQRAAEPGGPGVLRGESDLAERSVRDIMPGEVTRIVVDKQETAGQIHRLLRIWYPSQSAAVEAVGHATVRAATAASEVPLGEIANPKGTTLDDEVAAVEDEEDAPAIPPEVDVDPDGEVYDDDEAPEDEAEAQDEGERLAQLQVVARTMPEVELHTDAMPLFHTYNVESQLEDAFRRSIRLPSGGSIVIDPTEALVAIDVNSGRLTDAADPERTALVTNLEAVAEAARQLRLRDLGGLVVLDFIDMRERASRREVEKAFRAALSHDRARIRLGRMDPFGLMVLSRQRIRRALTRVTHEECPSCGGTGRRRHIPGLGLRVLREMEARVARSRGRGGLEVRAPAEVCAWIRKHRAADLRRVKRACNGPVTLEADERLARDGWAMKGLAPDGTTDGNGNGSEG